MKTNLLSLSLTALCITLPLSLSAQTDTTLERNVVVEREFQPIIQHAGKINTIPKQVETTIEPVKLSYSDYSTPFTPQPSTPTLASSAVRFAHPQPTKGWLSIAAGHPATYLDFGYGIKDKSGLNLNLFAQHDGDWDLGMKSISVLGMNIQKSFNKVNLRFDVDGNHLFFARYGRYFDGDKHLSINRYSDYLPQDLQHTWTVNTMFSVSSKGSAIPYLIQAGYTAYLLPDYVNEHIIHSRFWSGMFFDDHTVALNFVMQNAMMSVDNKLSIADSLYNHRHGFRIEPYYEYKSDELNIHAGVNLDLNIGKGQLLTNNKDLAFAPSPNIEFEYRIIPSWLVAYANARGNFSFGNIQEFMLSNCFRAPVRGITSHHLPAYTPVDANIGFKIKAAKTLMIDFYAGYAYLMNQTYMIAPTLTDIKTKSLNSAFLDYDYADYQRWKVGANINYHYQDIISFDLGGNYYYWINQNSAYGILDCPSWDAHLRIDANIDSKWSLYSDNQLAGARNALLTDNTIAKLKPTIDLSLGVRYNVNRWIYVYAQLNNYLHRHNDIYYGYQTCGIHGLVGFSWKF